MRIGRTLPPAAAPISWRGILSGLWGVVRSEVETERFKVELQDYFNIQHCYLLSSGKAALTVTLLALKRLYPDRDRVLIPAFTCYSVPSAITCAGLKVALCDVASGSFDFDEEQLQACLDDPRLLCVLPTHLFGSIADIPRLRRMLQGRSIPIVEDAAQALGATWQDSRVGTEGDVSLFSLGRGKALSTVEGGILLTDNSEIAAAIDQEMAALAGYTVRQLLVLILVAMVLKVLMTPSLFWLPKSLPFLRLGETRYDPDFPLMKMTNFQAGLSRSWQERLDSFMALRRRNSEYWTALSTRGVLRPYLSQNPLPDLIRFPVMCVDEAERQMLLRESERHGLGLAPVYPDAINGITELQNGFVGEKFPMARKLARRLVTLPVHSFVSSRDRSRIACLFDRRGIDFTTASSHHAGRAR